MAVIDNSTYLDFTAYGLSDPNATVQQAFHLSEVHNAPAGVAINVAITLDRANDPTALLAGSWAERQSTLAGMTSDQLWETYGASATSYDAVTDYLTTSGYTILGDNSALGNYVTSAESRTIWVQLDPTQFQTLFGTQLMLAGPISSYDFLYWDGALSLPDEIAVYLDGLWFDSGYGPHAIDQAGSASVTLPQGPQSIGNSTTTYNGLTPQQIAELYNFPLDGQAVQTGTIGFIEPGIGTAVPGSTSFQDELNIYLAMIGRTGTGLVYTQGADGQAYNSDSGGERSLDIGIGGAVNPNSTIIAYAGSGDQGYASSTTYTAYQSAIWESGAGVPGGATPSVLSSSWGDSQNPSPDSPFYRAYSQLFVDAALRNQTVLTALGDGGSGNETSSGLTNVSYNYASQYGLLVGGTSVSTGVTAASDTTLATMVSAATNGDLQTIWQLMGAGLKSSPQTAGDLSVFVETVWNTYNVEGDHIRSTNQIFEAGYLVNSTTSGGVDTTQGTPSYQTAFGLSPTTVDTGLTGRGAPDIAANAGGNLNYLIPSASMEGMTLSGGTSAATPLWSSLTVQLNAIFEDQGLPQLGYMNDLLYLAAAVSPAAFNDISMGNNTSSFYYGGDYHTNGRDITPTGYGYEAGEGYDLTTGLGSPNGLLLARALTTIAHTQMYFDTPAVLDQSGSDWTSGAGQSLLFQSSLASDADWSLTLGTSSVSFSGLASDTYAWNARLAQQSLQADFSSDLVTMFDGQSQGQLYQATVADGADVGIAIGGSAAAAYQASLTADYGYVDFVTGDGAVNVARPVAVATTAGGADDQDVVVRMRQNGMNDVSVLFYAVDDFSGTINGLTPDDAGYAAAVAARAYQTSDGGTTLAGAGYGGYSQGEITGVDAGDLIAMRLTSNANTFYAFASANESVNGQDVAHLWSYGLNTFGWEDLYGGGDTDYNDLIVQLDFTSASGSQWLV